MPLPSPREGEQQSEFIGRCMDDENMRSEFPDSIQRVAVCHSKWREKKMVNEGRGTGKGKGNPPVGDGGASACVCPTCKYTKPHERGYPCVSVKCPKCGTQMIGK